MKLQHPSAFVISLYATLAPVSALSWNVKGTGSGQTNGGGPDNSATGIGHVAVGLPPTLACAGKIFARLKVVVTNS